MELLGGVVVFFLVVGVTRTLSGEPTPSPVDAAQAGVEPAELAQPLAEAEEPRGEDGTDVILKGAAEGFLRGLGEGFVRALFSGGH